MSAVTYEQFQIQMDRLTATYGKKAFESKPRMHMYWESVKALPYELVIVIIDTFIRSSKSVPLPSDFGEAVAALGRAGAIKSFSLGEVRPKEMCKCRYCGDSGFVRLQRIEGYDPTWAKFETGSAPCHCMRGRELIEAGKKKSPPWDFGPQFNDAWKSSYEIQPEYQEVGR